MPELPEVETIRSGLEKKIVGLTIQKIQVLNPKTFQGDVKLAEGKQVVGVWRRAKMLGIDLDSRQSSVRQPRLRGQLADHQTKNKKSLTAEDSVLTTLLFHLKMTGQLIYDDGQRIIGGHPTPDMRDTMPNFHTRVIFEFSDPSRQKVDEASGSKLYFNDQRKFGWIKLINSSEFMIHAEKIFGKLGPEPLEKDFTWVVLKQNLLKHKNQPIKVAIMDQSVVSGIGNIYASEALFDAKINPRKKVGKLTDNEFKTLFTGIRKALAMGIEHGGSSKAHFVDTEGKKGYFLDYANVYGKEGYPCNRCKGKVEKITQAGRGTYFCEHCQK